MLWRPHHGDIPDLRPLSRHSQRLDADGLARTTGPRPRLHRVFSASYGVQAAASVVVVVWNIAVGAESCPAVLLCKSLGCMCTLLHAASLGSVANFRLEWRHLMCVARPSRANDFDIYLCCTDRRDLGLSRPDHIRKVRLHG